MTEIRKTIETKMILLTKQSWSVTDVMNYYGMSRNTARRMIALAISQYGLPPIDKSNKVRCSAKSDGMIKLMGGVSREEEAKVLNALLNNN